VLTLDEGNVQERLRSAILAAWNSAEQVRPRLLDAASSQLAASRAAYEMLRNDLDSKRKPIRALAAGALG